MPEGHVSVAGDCFDGDADMKPGGKEVCDGKDNNCDNGIDNDVALELCAKQDGLCFGAKHTQDECVDGTWQPCTNGNYLANNPAFEVGGEKSCDALDNDCNGVLDDIVQSAWPICEKQKGVCLGKKHRLDQCKGAVGWLPCDATDYGAAFVGTEDNTELCDGLDNDCDGEVDEFLAAPACSKSKGVCAGAIRTCQGGMGWVDCTEAAYQLVADTNNGEAQFGFYEAVELTCDKADNDCDGTADEGNLCTAIVGHYYVYKQNFQRMGNQSHGWPGIGPKSTVAAEVSIGDMGYMDVAMPTLEHGSQSLFVGSYSTGKLYKLDGTLGEIWQTTLGNAIVGPTLQLGDGGLVQLTRGKIYSLYEDGSLKWSAGVGTFHGEAPAVASGLVLVAGGYWTGGGIYAVSMDGTTQWSKSIPYNTVANGVTLSIDKKTWYVTGFKCGGDQPSPCPSVGSAGYLAAYEVETGVQKWVMEVASTHLSRPMVHIDGTIYVTKQGYNYSGAGTLFAVADKGDGFEVKWQTDLPGCSTAHDASTHIDKNTSPGENVPGDIFVSCKATRAVKVRHTDGEVLAQGDSPGTFSTPFFVNVSGTVVAGTTNGSLVWMNHSNLSVTHELQFAPGCTVGYPMANVNSEVFVGTSCGSVFKLK